MKKASCCSSSHCYGLKIHVTTRTELKEKKKKTARQLNVKHDMLYVF